MKTGIPLDDSDGTGWLEVLGHYLAARDPVVLACSALRKTYRDRLRELAGSLDFSSSPSTGRCF